MKKRTKIILAVVGVLVLLFVAMGFIKRKDKDVARVTTAKVESIDLVSKVTANGEDGKKVEYTIVGAAEAQPTKGLISNESPVGRALLGKRVGDEVQVTVPRGVLRLSITAIG